MEFSKKIVVWAIVYTSLTTVLWTAIYIILGDVSGELIGLTGAVITGVIVSYSAKAGAENYIKIKGRNKEEA
ncbi:MAG: hypothetical protein WCL21_18155 [Mariniphaga sp.]